MSRSLLVRCGNPGSSPDDPFVPETPGSDSFPTSPYLPSDTTDFPLGLRTRPLQNVRPSTPLDSNILVPLLLHLYKALHSLPMALALLFCPAHTPAGSSAACRSAPASPLPLSILLPSH